MTSRAQAVIGAGYGDEGKGRMVDAIAHGLGAGTVVVRSNGGAQAGHSVVTPDGYAHVFHHCGSGALAGAATHLSRFMVSQPMMLVEELRAVAALGGTIAITADPRGFVTTPWDMMANQAVEVARGPRRHGSCGLGFGETVGRCEETGYALTVADLARRDLRQRLIAIRDGWLPARLAALGVASGGAGSEFLVAARSDGLLERYLADCGDYLEFVAMRPDGDLGSAAHVLFEGAQGLMLDQHHRDFPFVTRSNTGIANMVAIAAEAGVDRIDAHYMTRCYVTRHGRGPMVDQRDLGGLFAVVDPTNQPNPWQETIRTGLLDVDVLAATIRSDLDLAAGSRVDVVPHLGLSCLDQAIGGRVTFIDGGMVRGLDIGAFVDLVQDRVRAATIAASFGPTRSSIQFPLPLAGEGKTPQAARVRA